MSLPSSLTITTKTKELQPETPQPQLPLLHQMLTEHPLMGAAMQMMTSSSPSLPGLPSSADLLQQAHALQLLAQLQSVLLVNRQEINQVSLQALWCGVVWCGVVVWYSVVWCGGMQTIKINVEICFCWGHSTQFFQVITPHQPSESIICLDWASYA